MTLYPVLLATREVPLASVSFLDNFARIDDSRTSMKLWSFVNFLTSRVTLIGKKLVSCVDSVR